LLVPSCSFFQPTATVLPNGVSIDEATKDRLLSLTDDFKTLLAEKEEAAKSMNPNESVLPAPVQAAREILLREFGEAGLDYMIYGEYERQTVEIPAAGDSARYLVQIGNDGNYTYYLDGLCAFCTLPWGSWNWATALAYRRSISTGNNNSYTAAALRAKIVDSATPYPGNSSQVANEKEANAPGNMAWGFFPPHPTNITTWYDVYDGVLYNGEAHLVLSWM
jgi:hypothetical protein